MTDLIPAEATPMSAGAMTITSRITVSRPSRTTTTWVTVTVPFSSTPSTTADAHPTAAAPVWSHPANRIAILVSCIGFVLLLLAACIWWLCRRAKQKRRDQVNMAAPAWTENRRLPVYPHSSSKSSFDSLHSARSAAFKSPFRSHSRSSSMDGSSYIEPFHQDSPRRVTSSRSHRRQASVEEPMLMTDRPRPTTPRGNGSFSAYSRAPTRQQPSIAQSHMSGSAWEGSIR